VSRENEAGRTSADPSLPAAGAGTEAGSDGTTGLLTGASPLPTGSTGADFGGASTTAEGDAIGDGAAATVELAGWGVEGAVGAAPSPKPPQEAIGPPGALYEVLSKPL
jgi:hypothetical protein